jgi:hypothetical protein
MRRLFVALAVALSIGGLASAEQLIWDNAGASSINDNLSVIDVINTLAGGNTSEVADDFILAAPMMVTRIAPRFFFGANFVVDYWNINIYDDAAGVPGTLLAATTAPGASYLANNPLNPTGDQILSLVLATPFSAAANTRYWISLQAAFDQAQGTGLRWREKVVADPSGILGNVGYWRGTPLFGGLTQLWTWEKVGQKNGVPDVAEMQFTLYGDPAGLCADANCDGLVNNGDIDAFVMALTDPVNYAATYGCAANCDTNQDTLVNNGDIDSFVAAVVGGGCQALP